MNRPILTLKKGDNDDVAKAAKQEFYRQVCDRLCQAYGLTPDQVSVLATGRVHTIEDSIEFVRKALVTFDPVQIKVSVKKVLTGLRDDHRYHAKLRAYHLPEIEAMPLWRVRKVLEAVEHVLAHIGLLLKGQAETVASSQQASPEQWATLVRSNPAILQRLQSAVQATSLMALQLTDRQLAELANPPIDKSQPLGPQLEGLYRLVQP